MALVRQQPGLTDEPGHAAIGLDDPAATDAAVAGSKAASLARAKTAGLPVIDGFVIPVDVVRLDPHQPASSVQAAWYRLTEGGARSLVVRSSSPVEDLETSSMAGVFDSVVDVRGWEGFVDAYRQVAASAGRHPMAILVQHLVTPEFGGVLFGVDPVSGRADHRMIVAVHGGPHALVSGTVEGRHMVVDRRSRVRSTGGDPSPALRRGHRRSLVTLAAHAAELFGGPQDIEWAIDRGRLLLLQSRAVTVVARTGHGPVLGPGPVAETFPAPLPRLALDLWVPPLRRAMQGTLALTGSASRRRLAGSEVVSVVDRQVAVDLVLTGVEASGGSRVVRLLDPRPSLRRLAAAWRTGRLRGALPLLADRLLADIDHELGSIPDLADLHDDRLLDVLDNATAYLEALHGHEMLVGALADDPGATGADAGLRAIARGRASGWSDDDIVARFPEALSVVAPNLDGTRTLPDVGALDVRTHDQLSRREELRLRVRLVHELTRQVVLELGHRLVVRNVLPEPGAVARLDRNSLHRAIRGDVVDFPPVEAPPLPLPSRFRVDDAGGPVPVAGGASASIGAGGGRGQGPVAFDDPREGDVLVVRTLDPGFAPVLPRLAGLVAETGSALSHLAILAREHGVPVVVGYADATTRFAAGEVLLVDGHTGEVQAVGASPVSRTTEGGR